MTLIINGEQQTAADDLSIADLLATFGYPDQGVAVAVDGAVVPRSSWHRPITAGAAVEIVTAVQGG